jgi:hypothetical protein
MRSSYLLISGLLATLCSASPLTITLSGNASGNFTPANSSASQSFAGSPFTFSFTTDTSLVQQSTGGISGTIYQTPFVPGTVTIDGLSGAFSSPVAVQVNGTYVNFEDQPSSGSSFAVVGGASPSLYNNSIQYNLQSSIGPVTLGSPGGNVAAPYVATSFGNFNITSVSNAVFTASVGPAPVIITLSGNASGNFIPPNSTTPEPFSGSPFTFSLISDTSLIQPFAGGVSGTIYQTPFVPGTVSIDGMSGTFSSAVAVQVNGTYVNFESQIPTGYFGVFGGTSTSLFNNNVQYNLQSAIGPLQLSGLQPNVNPQYLLTSFGSFNVTSVNNATFTVSLGAPATLPHVGAGATWTTGIYVINTSDQTVLYTIAFRDNNGNPAPLPFPSGASSTLTGSLPPQGSSYVEAANAQAPLITAWGQIAADPAIVVQALLRDSESGTNYEGGIPSAQAGTGFEIPFDATTFAATNQPLYTGIAVANLDQANTAYLTCTARDGSGNPIPNGLTVPPIAPQGHWANYLFPALTGLRGTIDCISTTSIAVLALRFIGTTAFSTLPVIVK